MNIKSLIFCCVFIFLLFEFKVYGQSPPQCTGEWTTYFDRDRPESRVGDFETLTEIMREYPGAVCSNPIGIDVKVVSTGNDYRSAGQRVEISAQTGFKCFNEQQQTNQICLDYTVRFCCPSGTFLKVGTNRLFNPSLCPGVERKYQCGDESSNSDPARCRSQPGCCYDDTSRPQCYVNTEVDILSTTNFKETQRMLFEPKKPPQPENAQELTQLSRSLPQDLKSDISETNLNNIESRTSSVISSFTATRFPKCAVETPMCYRTQCNADNFLSETNPIACLSNPLCCFDQDLFVYRLFFGTTYMGGAPVCYYGPTSRLYQRIANLVRPYNAFFQPTIASIFNIYMNNGLDRLACYLPSGMMCGWTGITKTQCLMKGCCFSDSDNSCTYPNPKKNEVFNLQTKEFYPEFSSSSSEETCPSSEPGLLSSMLYRRLPCLKHNNLFVLQLTCPGLGCCLYNSVNVGSLLLSGVASSSSTSGNTHNIFCPYRFASIPGFPDLSESVGDCCELKTCYHPNSSPFAQENCQWTAWSGWSLCGGSCNPDRQQRRNRQCIVSTTGVACNRCVGNSVETINCQPCTTQTTNSPTTGWGQWNSWGECSRECGGGERFRTRSCLSIGESVESVDKSNCDPTSGDRNGDKMIEICNSESCLTSPVCSWSSWSSSQCSSTCVGTITKSRSCLCNNMQRDASNCGGNAEEKERCRNTNLQAIPWSGWTICGYIENERVRRRQRCLLCGGSCVPEFEKEAC